MFFSLPLSLFLEIASDEDLKKKECKLILSLTNNSLLNKCFQKLFKFYKPSLSENLIRATKE